LARLFLLVALLAALAGCGADERVGELADDARRELREERARIEAEVRRIRERIDELIGQLEQVVPRAERTSPDVEARGRTEGTTVDAFLTDVLENVDAYWTRTFAANGLPEPRVRYAWVEPGRVLRTGCGAPADDNAAFYCPADDTIYIAQRFAAALYAGVLRGLPGEASGGRAAGDFGVAYIVAHEYAHNLQDELDLFSLARSNSSKPFELQADCLAGAWGSSVYAEGRLQPGDIEEAVGTALAVGDFDISSANHHGTPEERRAAWLAGFEGADPSVCARYVPAT
jgi:predicted metalloprotease